MRKGMTALVMLAFALAVAGPAWAEDQGGTSGQVVRKDEMPNLRKEIVKLKYVQAEQIRTLLYLYVSRDGHIQSNPNLPGVLTVSDTPENVDKILAAIRELDVKPADVLFTVQLVLGSEADPETDADLKNDPVVKELGKLLRYKGYTLLDGTLVRVVNRENASVVLGPKAEFQFELRPEVAGDAKAPVIKTEVRLRKMSFPGSEKPVATTLIESSLNIKSGERTVVGVSKLDGGDKGLILIISAKIVD